LAAKPNINKRMQTNLENIWYLPSSNTWKNFQIMAMKDIGTLTLHSGVITFNGKNTNLIIGDIVSVSYGKQGRDFINNWVKLDFYNKNHELTEAYFADGNNGGWSGIFGGTKKIYNLIKDQYSNA